MRESAVDLPHPVGPTMLTNSPAATSRSTSLRAVKAEPAGVANFFVAARSEIAGGVISVMPGNVGGFESIAQPCAPCVSRRHKLRFARSARGTLGDPAAYG